jgi:hypothetical protein
MSNNPQQQPPTKEQEALNGLNNAFANLQASGTTLGNAMKSLQEGANAMVVAFREKDAEIANKNIRIKELEALVPKELKEKTPEVKKQ